MIPTWLSTRPKTPPPDPDSFWILTNGIWNDEYIWEDIEEWED